MINLDLYFTHLWKDNLISVKLIKLPHPYEEMASDAKESKIKADKKLVELESSWIEDDDVDFVSELKDLPSNFQQTLIPDLESLYYQIQ